MERSKPLGNWIEVEPEETVPPSVDLSFSKESATPTLLNAWMY